MNLNALKNICLPSILLLTFTRPLLAQDEAGFSAEGSVDYFSQYIWRGLKLNTDSVLQFNAQAGIWGLTAAVWLDMPLTRANGTRTAGKPDEIDFLLDFSRNIPGLNDIVGYSVGIAHYRFMEYDDPTTEIYGGLNFNIPSSPSITWNRDIGTIDGSYICLGLGHTFENLVTWSDSGSINLELNASVALGTAAYNAGYFETEKTRFNDFTLNVALPINLKYGISIAPSFNTSTMLSKDIRDAYVYGNRKPTSVWAGIKLSISYESASAASTETPSDAEQD